MSHINTRSQATADWDFHRVLKIGLNTGANEGCWRRRHDSVSGPGAGQSCCAGDWAFDAMRERARGESPVQSQEGWVWLGPWPLILSLNGFPGTGQGSWQTQQVFGEIQRFKGISGCA